MHASSALSLLALCGSALCGPIIAGPAYMSTVNTWRANLGLPVLSFDTQLESNVLQAVISANGQVIQVVKQGSVAQVVAAGSLTQNFQLVLDGWIASGTESNRILADLAYTRIGCADAAGIVACYLA